MVSCYLWGFNNGLETWFGSHYFKVEIDMLRFGAECKLSFIDGAESLSVKENQRFEQHEIATIIQTAVFHLGQYYLFCHLIFQFFRVSGPIGSQK